MRTKIFLFFTLYFYFTSNFWGEQDIQFHQVTQEIKNYLKETENYKPIIPQRTFDYFRKNSDHIQEMLHDIDKEEQIADIKEKTFPLLHSMSNILKQIHSIVDHNIPKFEEFLGNPKEVFEEFTLQGVIYNLAKIIYVAPLLDLIGNSDNTTENTILSYLNQLSYDLDLKIRDNPDLEVIRKEEYLGKKQSLGSSNTFWRKIMFLKNAIENSFPAINLFQKNKYLSILGKKEDTHTSLFGIIHEMSSIVQKEEPDILEKLKIKISEGKNKIDNYLFELNKNAFFINFKKASISLKKTTQLPSLVSERIFISNALENLDTEYLANLISDSTRSLSREQSILFYELLGSYDSEQLQNSFFRNIILLEKGVTQSIQNCKFQIGEITDDIGDPNFPEVMTLYSYYNYFRETLEKNTFCSCCFIGENLFRISNSLQSLTNHVQHISNNFLKLVIQFPNSYSINFAFETVKKFFQSIYEELCSISEIIESESETDSTFEEDARFCASYKLETSLKKIETAIEVLCTTIRKILPTDSEPTEVLSVFNIYQLNSKEAFGEWFSSVNNLLYNNLEILQSSVIRLLEKLQDNTFFPISTSIISCAKKIKEIAKNCSSKLSTIFSYEKALCKTNVVDKTSFTPLFIPLNELLKLEIFPDYGLDLIVLNITSSSEIFKLFNIARLFDSLGNTINKLVDTGIEEIIMKKIWNSPVNLFSQEFSKMVKYVAEIFNSLNYNPDNTIEAPLHAIVSSLFEVIQSFHTVCFYESGSSLEQVKKYTATQNSYRNEDLVEGLELLDYSIINVSNSFSRLLQTIQDSECLGLNIENIDDFKNLSVQASFLQKNFDNFVQKENPQFLKDNIVIKQNLLKVSENLKTLQKNFEKISQELPNTKCCLKITKISKKIQINACRAADNFIIFFKLPFFSYPLDYTDHMMIIQNHMEKLAKNFQNITVSIDDYSQNILHFFKTSEKFCCFLQETYPSVVKLKDVFVDFKNTTKHILDSELYEENKTEEKEAPLKEELKSCESYTFWEKTDKKIKELYEEVENVTTKSNLALKNLLKLQNESDIFSKLYTKNIFDIIRENLDVFPDNKYLLICSSMLKIITPLDNIAQALHKLAVIFRNVSNSKPDICYGCNFLQKAELFFMNSQKVRKLTNIIKSFQEGWQMANNLKDNKTIEILIKTNKENLATLSFKEEIKETLEAANKTLAFFR